MIYMVYRTRCVGFLVLLFILFSLGKPFAQNNVTPEKLMWPDRLFVTEGIIINKHSVFRGGVGYDRYSFRSNHGVFQQIVIDVEPYFDVNVTPTGIFGFPKVISTTAFRQSSWYFDQESNRTIELLFSEDLYNSINSLASKVFVTSFQYSLNTNSGIITVVLSDGPNDKRCEAFAFTVGEGIVEIERRKELETDSIVKLFYSSDWLFYLSYENRFSLANGGIEVFIRNDNLALKSTIIKKDLGNSIVCGFGDNRVYLHQPTSNVVTTIALPSGEEDVSISLDLITYSMFLQDNLYRNSIVFYE